MQAITRLKTGTRSLLLSRTETKWPNTTYYKWVLHVQSPMWASASKYYPSQKSFEPSASQPVDLTTIHWDPVRPNAIYYVQIRAYMTKNDPTQPLRIMFNWLQPSLTSTDPARSHQTSYSLNKESNDPAQTNMAQFTQPWQNTMSPQDQTKPICNAAGALLSFPTTFFLSAFSSWMQNCRAEIFSSLQMIGQYQCVLCWMGGSPCASRLHFYFWIPSSSLDLLFFCGVVGAPELIWEHKEWYRSLVPFTWLSIDHNGLIRHRTVSLETFQSSAMALQSVWTHHAHLPSPITCSQSCFSAGKFTLPIAL